MLKAIFYARFHPERGPDVLFQHPPGTITHSSDASPSSHSVTATELLIDFSEISAYIIPPPDLCNRALGLCTRGHRVLGFPVSIEGSQYERNRFVFNVCFVLDEDVAQGLLMVWDGIVAKTAGFLRGLEVEEGGMLKKAEAEEGVEGKVGLVGRILREVCEQLNAYGEGCVQVNEAQVLNLRLSQPMGDKRVPKVRDWDVPLLVRKLPGPESWTWDVVLEKIVPCLDGISHVKRIAELADVDVRLVRKAVRGLVMHDFAIVLDIFHFQAVYTLTQDFSWFVSDLDMQEECRRYVTIEAKYSMFARSTEFHAHQRERAIEPPSRAILIELYGSLRPGLSVADLCLAHTNRVYTIDIRRFMTFGVIKGFLRRKHKYVLALDPPTIASPDRRDIRSGIGYTAADVDKAWRKAALSSGWATPPADVPAEFLHGTELEGEDLRMSKDKMLVQILDGKKCLDGVCVEMAMSEKQVLDRVSSGRFGEIVVFSR